MTTLAASGIEQVAAERESVAMRLRIHQAHKAELEKASKAHRRIGLSSSSSGVRHATFDVTSVSHPLARTVRILSDAAGARGDHAGDRRRRQQSLARSPPCCGTSAAARVLSFHSS